MSVYCEKLDQPWRQYLKPLCLLIKICLWLFPGSKIHLQDVDGVMWCLLRPAEGALEKELGGSAFLSRTGKFPHGRHHLILVIVINGKCKRGFHGTQTRTGAIKVSTAGTLAQKVPKGALR